MAKKHSKLRRSKRSHRRRRNSDDETMSEPRERASRATEAATELAYTVGAGFAGYAATRITARGAVVFAGKKYPKLVKHAGPIGAAIGAAGAWFASRYWEKVADHHEAVTVGAGVALAQSVVQTYLPKWAWVVSDQPAPSQAQIAAAPSDADLRKLLDDHDLVEGPAVAQLPAVPAAAAPTPGALTDDELDDFNGMFN